MNTILRGTILNLGAARAFFEEFSVHLYFSIVVLGEFTDRMGALTTRFGK
jgi:hypothetical protein